MGAEGFVVVVRLVRVGTVGRLEDVGLRVLCGSETVEDFRVVVGGWHWEYPIASHVRL